ncbi:hypothetical protein PR202_ga10288 [Eleusine coracana subsp. coracana]|uniref:Uncharacterized protein n=1 Tax=Eleusine coracana subsp. coracana TaxID=191504 RepID=A0AAV5C6B9_ELECO|nr:hypothetical protein PR202_ga10288 [Eleusine coracana subsp. coracana]
MAAGEGGRGGEEGPRGGPEDGRVAAVGVRSAAGPAPAGGRDRGRVRARHGVHVDRAAQEGGAPLQVGEQAGELRRGGHRVRASATHQEAQGRQGQGAHAVAARQRDHRQRPAHRQDPLQEPRWRRQDVPR